MRTSPLPGTKGIRRLSEPAELGQRWPHLIGDLTSAAILPAHGSAHSLGPERQPPHAEQNLYVLDRRLERILAAFSIGCQVGSCASACSPAGRTCSSSRPVATSDCADLSSIHMVLSRRVLFMGLPPVGSVHPETWHSRKRRTKHAFGAGPKHEGSQHPDDGGHRSDPIWALASQIIRGLVPSVGSSRQFCSSVFYHVLGPAFYLHWELPRRSV